MDKIPQRVFAYKSCGPSVPKPLDVLNGGRGKVQNPKELSNPGP